MKMSLFRCRFHQQWDATFCWPAALPTLGLLDCPAPAPKIATIINKMIMVYSPESQRGYSGCRPVRHMPREDVSLLGRYDATEV